MSDLKKKLLLSLLRLSVVAVIFNVSMIGYTNSYFNDQEKSDKNTFSAGTWEKETEEEVGDVIINEVMWMGSNFPAADEWIELRNTTGSPINLTGWKIDGAGSGSSSITLSGTIPASGFFLLSDNVTSASAMNDSISADQVTPSLSLSNTGEQITLKDGVDNVIDQTPVTWPAGVNGPSDWKSMERNDAPGDGTLAENWHTCNEGACHSIVYWDEDGRNWGTPKGANLSTYDPNLILHLSADKKTASFTVSNIYGFIKLSYQLSYETNSGSQGILGSTDLKKQDSFSQDNLILGTCSSGGICVYHSGIKNMKLAVSLEDKEGKITALEKIIP